MSEERPRPSRTIKFFVENKTDELQIINLFAQNQKQGIICELDGHYKELGITPFSYLFSNKNLLLKKITVYSPSRIINTVDFKTIEIMDDGAVKQSPLILSKSRMQNQDSVLSTDEDMSFDINPFSFLMIYIEPNKNYTVLLHLINK